jgi:hypothetical protein
MMASQDRKDIVGAIVGGALMLAAGGFFTFRYYSEPHPDAASAEALRSNGLNIPTVDQMCQRQGATAANMADCRNEENQAGEFVIAWMGLHGFLTNGVIDPAQIEYAGEVAEDATPPDVDPDAEPNIDPATGQPVDQEFASTPELAMYCLSNSMDWLQLHDCISRYDPSTRFTGQ